MSKSEISPNFTQPILVAKISHTPEQAAAVTGRSRSRIFKAIKAEELTARKDGGATIIEDEELRRWVRSLPTIGRRLDARQAAT